ncbi:MAG: SAM-dependent chlorinase/fluorinase, partial [Elusimicrobia bacterium]|nr:SAM-dependent chlorinase/fluorinase [Elusimicrobiota bacterium]
MKHDTIALLTDFGYDSPFTGIMKGVIAKINPSAKIADLNNGIAPGDIFAAGFELSISEKYFDKTVFVCVVDPTVGSKRKIIIAESEKNLF